MGYGHHLGRSSINYSQNECLHKEKLPLEMTPDVDSDNFDLAEVGCEHIMIGSRTCSVPYELYDLPDLKGVLSLETWNHQLNENERFFLATFLPDMDQETFWLTVKELLMGNEMLFGSPLHKFYTGMKGGLYSPQVTYSRECLVFLQKNEYYHRVRSYHENMLQAFSEMKKLWDGCRRNLTVEERIHIWKSRRENKPRFLVDLNAFPDEDILNKCDQSVESLPSSKKARCVNEGHYSTILLNGLVCNINRKGKGVLKLKPILTKPVQRQVMEPSPDKPEQPSKRLPKGVLRIKRKYDHHSQVAPRINLEQISAWDNCAPNFSSQQFALKKDEVENHKETRLDTTTIREGLLISDVRSDNSEHLGNGSKIDKVNVSVSGAEKCPMFPITYKRKKPYKKVNHKDTLKQQTQEPVAVCLDSSTTNGAVKPKRMAIKIKFRGLTGQSG